MSQRQLYTQTTIWAKSLINLPHNGGIFKKNFLKKPRRWPTKFNFKKLIYEYKN